MRRAKSGDLLVADGGFHGADHQIGGFRSSPGGAASFRRERMREPGSPCPGRRTFGCRAVGGFEAGVLVGDAGWGDADPADLRGQGIGDVAVQVEGGDDVVFGRTQQNLLQEGVGDGVLTTISRPVRGFELAPRPAVDQLGAELLTPPC